MRGSAWGPGRLPHRRHLAPKSRPCVRRSAAGDTPSTETQKMHVEAALRAGQQERLEAGDRLQMIGLPQHPDEHGSENGGVPEGGQRGFPCSPVELMGLVRLGLHALDARCTRLRFRLARRLGSRVRLDDGLTVRRGFSKRPVARRYARPRDPVNSPPPEQCRTTPFGLADALADQALSQVIRIEDGKSIIPGHRGSRSGRICRLVEKTRLHRWLAVRRGLPVCIDSGLIGF